MRPEKPRGLSRRKTLLLVLGLLGIGSHFVLGLSFSELWPSAARLESVLNFSGAALRPAFDYEDRASLPAEVPDFLIRLSGALWRTVTIALCAWSLAFLVAVPFGVLASEEFWKCRRGLEPSRRMQVIRICVRFGLVATRSVHELLWAVLLLAALGLNTATAIVALAIPMCGTLGKVFSELLDEHGASERDGIRSTGARSWQVFAFGVLPRALPDLMSFGSYRLECGLRSSAVLGFFGFETLGYSLRQSFENLHYRETWTYLYAMALLVILLEAWSARMRRRFVA